MDGQAAVKLTLEEVKEIAQDLELSGVLVPCGDLFMLPREVLIDFIRTTFSIISHIDRDYIARVVEQSRTIDDILTVFLTSYFLGRLMARSVEIGVGDNPSDEYAYKLTAFTNALIKIIKARNPKSYIECLKAVVAAINYRGVRIPREKLTEVLRYG